MNDTHPDEARTGQAASAPEAVTLDGNEAAAGVAYALSDVIAIYPITPASPMGEHADEWAHQRRPDRWGAVPRVIEMQSEDGAAGAMHGALLAGAQTTTFTASQGLLLMLPNLYKIAGELTPAVIHVAARSIATHALSIFGDHSDVMAARQTGMAMLVVDPTWNQPETTVRALFYGLGSDGTVGANKNTVKIVGSQTDRYAQGYFVYDSKKSGSMTVSHLRFSPDPIESSYLVAAADFLACHWLPLLDRSDVLERARPGATLLLNTSHSTKDLWGHLSTKSQRTIQDKALDVWLVDADGIAAEVGLAGRTNTVLQACFFALTDLIETSDAVAAIKESIQSTYGQRGAVIVDRALDALCRLEVPAENVLATPATPTLPAIAPDFVQRVTASILEGKGDLLPVSALPVDGTFPTGTSKWEKRAVASEIPIWDSDICIDCGRCALVCPHAAIRMKVAAEADLSGTIKSKAWKGPEGELVVRGQRRVRTGHAPGRRQSREPGSMAHQKVAAETGYWPLYRFDPHRETENDHALHLDSRPPKRPFKEFAQSEGRFVMIARSNPKAAEQLFAAAQSDIDDRWYLYEQMVEVERTSRYVEHLEEP